MNAQPRDRALTWLAAAFAMNAVLSVAVHLGMAVAVGPTPETVRRALKATAPAQTLRLKDLQGLDSWNPMIAVYERKLDDPTSDPYAGVFISPHERFQYHPASLLIFDLFPRSVTRMVGDAISMPLRLMLDQLSRVAVGVTVTASTLIVELGLRRLAPDRPAPLVQRVVGILLSLALGLTFYPLLFGHFVGQIQVFLNALIALAVLFHLLGWRTLAGMCVGACSLVKPHYGLMLLWAVPRRQWRFTLGLVGVALTGLALSIARFGLRDHLRYLDALQLMSRGEFYWPNQSVNGLLNRLLETGDPLRPLASNYAPDHPIVYVLTAISAVAFLTLALWPLRGDRRMDGDHIGLAVMVVAVTMASPIVWIPHYGAFLPIFAATLPALIQFRPFGRATAVLFAACYVAIANLLVWPPVIFQNRWLGLAGSHMFFGSLILFGLLLRLRTTGGTKLPAHSPGSAGVHG